ncbi:MAG: serine--tRNA ligase [Elusimicrobia bacterium GWA2_56_46]|nr:MAG: serine--tRNA ligase [Elusimicrobia bacterium GWA2_56_46]OGR56210.1 MAG: serine--tRNA ligase [Elusimicrobia bacterium GWC2_56_31]HBB66961.1 serine--tRNA ligase [Elusimicrobiota bacterium]HBW23013.1 serine--tRNA ligase [Elusimicrobiota bacterium]
MLDIRLIRSDPNRVRTGLRDRGGRYLPALDKIIETDGAYLAVLAETEALRSRRNEVSQKIQGLKIAKKEAEAKAVMDEANAIKETIRSKEESLSALEKELNCLLLGVPNLPDGNVVKGGGPQENKVVYQDPGGRREFSFKPLDHHALGESLGILDFAAATRLSGSRFALLKGPGARLERAITQLMLDTHTLEHGYTEIFPPFLVNSESMTGTGQLPKFEEDLYKVAAEPPLYLIPTAEVPLTNLCRGEVLKEESLPWKFTAYTACFRQEAGSYGKDTRGLIRNHQFNKVELVWITRPEDSMAALTKLRADAEKILRLLGIPYRVLELCTGDLGFSSAMTYDLEVWMPGENKFREISSCSNCGDFQARRMNARFKRADGKKTEFVHTLNGSGLAVGRTFAAILENYQEEDGSVTVPEALRKYMGTDKIESL